MQELSAGKTMVIPEVVMEDLDHFPEDTELRKLKLQSVNLMVFMFA